jgi:CheY-like chemotaxis protein
VNLPLALLSYEDLMPGTQLVNRLEALKYRVVTVSAGELPGVAAISGPMLIFCDLVSKSANPSGAIQQLRANPATAHVPIIAFADDTDKQLPLLAEQAGANLVTTDSAILSHLEQLIQQALQVE